MSENYGQSRLVSYKKVLLIRFSDCLRNISIVRSLVLTNCSTLTAKIYSPIPLVRFIVLLSRSLFQATIYSFMPFSKDSFHKSRKKPYSWFSIPTNCAVRSSQLKMKALTDQWGAFIIVDLAWVVNVGGKSITFFLLILHNFYQLRLTLSYFPRPTHTHFCHVDPTIISPTLIWVVFF